MGPLMIQPGTATLDVNVALVPLASPGVLAAQVSSLISNDANHKIRHCMEGMQASKLCQAPKQGNIHVHVSHQDKAQLGRISPSCASSSEPRP